MNIVNRFIITGMVLSFISACGGGGGTPAPTPATPVTPSPATSELYMGYYTENEPNDPTPGVLYMYLPSTDTSFTGEFFFSYVGCQGSFDTGALNGAKTGTSFKGTWSGTVDGNAQTGTFKSTGVNSSSYTGSWTNDAGQQMYSFAGPCSYTFAGNGGFTIYKIANGTIPITVDLTSPFTPVFNFNLNSSSTMMKLNVFDKACLINGGSVSGCTMWEINNVNTGGGLPTSITYATGGINPKTLVSGNAYIVTAFSSDTNGNVLDFGSSEFLVP